MNRRHRRAVRDFMDRDLIPVLSLVPSNEGEAERDEWAKCEVLLSVQLGVFKKDQATRTVVPELSPAAAGNISASPCSQSESC